MVATQCRNFPKKLISFFRSGEYGGQAYRSDFSLEIGASKWLCALTCNKYQLCGSFYSERARRIEGRILQLLFGHLEDTHDTRNPCFHRRWSALFDGEWRVFRRFVSGSYWKHHVSSPVRTDYVQVPRNQSILICCEAITNLTIRRFLWHLS